MHEKHTEQCTNYRQLKSSEIQEVRNEILSEQNGLCALTGVKITPETGYSLDHQHMTLKENIGEDGAGLIRGVLTRAANVLEGKIWNNMSRYLQPESVQDRIDFLESLVEYYKKENYPMVHPNEKPKERSISKRQYNKLAKEYKESGKKARFPMYPNKGKMTKKLDELFSTFKINPYLD